MIIHIGLGKTATTTLQRNIFPYLKQKRIIEEYNPPKVMSLLGRFIATGGGLPELRNAIRKTPDNTIISFESLSSWNPEFWEDSLINNLKIFPKNSTVLITLRDPSSYLASVYLQSLHEGNIIKAEEYFLNNYIYSLSSKIMNGRLSQAFKVDDLDYIELVNIYRKEFKEVVVVSMESLLNLDFFKNYFNLTDQCFFELNEVFNKSKIENVSYSFWAVRLTFFREALLDYFGLRSRTSQDILRGLYLSFENKALRPTGFFNRALIKYRKYFQWRYFIQNVFDKIMPYKKYQLPKNIYKGVMFESNVEYYETIKSQGYIVYYNDFKLQ